MHASFDYLSTYTYNLQKLQTVYHESIKVFNRSSQQVRARGLTFLDSMAKEMAGESGRINYSVKFYAIKDQNEDEAKAQNEDDDFHDRPCPLSKKRKRKYCSN